MSELRVRRATLDDLHRIVEFTIAQVHEGEGAIKGRELLQQGIERALSDESLSLYWVLVDDNDVPVGCTSATREWSNWNNGFYWWVQSMFVDGSHRGMGGMNKLLDAIKQEMAKQGGVQLRIYLNKDNRAAKSAYERSGFQRSVYEVMVMLDDTPDRGDA
ncbi:MAG TPA: GNAT family N-acetyltransferase [Pseudomonadales bacterium]|nr:GNAT family N-acetyltransferase [Pseudomonadales bacterium]